MRSRLILAGVLSAFLTFAPLAEAGVSTPRAKQARRGCRAKCFTVQDKCIVAYRQFPDVERICRAKYRRCMRRCR